MAVSDGVASVAFPLIGCGLVGIDERMLICQFLDSLHRCDKQLTNVQSLHVYLVIYDLVQTDSVVSQLIDLLLAYRSRVVLTELNTTSMPILDRFGASIREPSEESWAKWQLCRFAEITLEIMCFGLFQADDPPPVPESLFELQVSVSFGKIREHAMRLAKSRTGQSSEFWGNSFFSKLLTDSAVLEKFEILNAQRNNLAHGRTSLPITEIQRYVNEGLRLNEWVRIIDKYGPFQIDEWKPWIVASSEHNGAVGIFERWQKSCVRYLVPETGLVFKSIR